MSKKIKQTIVQIGFKNNAATTANVSVPKGYMLVEKEEYNKRLEEHKENLENAVRRKELELQVAHNDEKIELYRQIAELQNKLADLPESLRKEQEKNAKLGTLPEQMGSKVAEEKFQKAIDAFKENKLTKADKILIEIEETGKLNKKEFGKIAYARGTVAEQDVRWQDAAEHYTRAAQLDPCFETLTMAQKFAITTGNYPSALSFGLDAQKTAIKEYGKNSREYAAVINNLGEIYRVLENDKETEAFFDESLDIRRNIMGEMHRDTGQSLNNLGTFYREKGQYNKAGLYLKQALKIYENKYGKKHPETAGILCNLAHVYDEKHLYKKAEPMHRKALKIRQEFLGENHPNISFSLNNLGLNYCNQGKYKKGVPLVKRAWEVLESNFGHAHPQTKLFRENYEIVKTYLT